MKRKQKPASSTEKQSSAAPPGPRPVSELRIPSLLLEGDENPSEKSTTRTSIVPELITVSQQPTLDLIARDPHSIYAHWDLPPSSQDDVPAANTGQPLILNVHRDNLSGPLAAQIRLTGESNHAFVPVPEGGTEYIAELCLDSGGGPQILATSTSVSTPVENVSRDRLVEYAEVSIREVRPVTVLQSIQKHVSEHDNYATQFVPPPVVSWIPVLHESGNAELGSQFHRSVAEPSMREIFATSSELGFREEQYRAYETVELEHLLCKTMSQLKTGDSSF